MANEPTLPALAKAIATNFPELTNRVVAVTEVEAFNQTSDSVKLPLAIVALLSEKGTQRADGGGNVNVEDDIIVQFMFTPEKYTNAEDRDTPFFAFYDYEALRDKLLSLTSFWRSPRNGGLSYQSLELETDESAVYVTFRFKLTEKLCVDPLTEASNFTVNVKTLPASLP